MKSMRDVFEEIYRSGAWVRNHENAPSLSGPGSFPDRVQVYHEILREFVARNCVRSVVDYGCGDNVVYQGFDWGGVDYTGIDISPTAVALAKKNYPGRKFICADTLNLPEADMLICKDVLGHWGNSASTSDLGDQRHLITTWLKLNYHKFPFIMITDGPEGTIDSFFPEEVRFSTQMVKFGSKTKRIYVKQ